MNTPTIAGKLSQEAERQLDELQKELDQKIKDWWPDEKRLRKAELSKAFGLVFELPPTVQPGVLGSLLLSLRQQRWKARPAGSPGFWTIEIFGPADPDYSDVNKVLSIVAEKAVYFMTTHDSEFKRYCLEMAAWDAVDEFADMVEKLPEILQPPIRAFLDPCLTARMEKQDANVSCKGHKIAAQKILILVKELETITTDHPEMKKRIKPTDLTISFTMFQNLKTAIDNMIENNKAGQ